MSAVDPEIEKGGGGGSVTPITFPLHPPMHVVKHWEKIKDKAFFSFL